ncbi:F0F1 ATP synthase subunit epsilon [Magnetospirillum gryphiswaldense]|jgi:F-type H+-transporting ATPase subunit epsilon|uniref:ATP synthase epsilon chain n=2 Tax=Magnetospirillum gryphiswaldense TaxID=55518 RepID=V6F6V8_MAGGM|nr:F0F1 ATP synthase subunit epsilon [Magnetospirillum gryphiswaldense]AVM75003.1 ATP synthase epsilon chain [Magnetospirillum gryphiswaldense MSR-1]AVM78906.1 ATP synthase epsilon chain [Magnetospirillum gryphiswaldense]CAM75788.1 ATP synthase F1, epsilon subunit [Magnetospirillum gryphiswaldense MSR-1]CDL01107.1 F1 sector of membrane-bound ATP synthase, epsilon subunit [Magnetospirillum gryphiswaldense MSR-1 v2]
MAEKIKFELVSPAKLLISESVDMVVVPGSEGDFGALALHAPMITTVRPGVINVHNDGKIGNRIFVAGGFAEVNEERVTVLAEEAIPVADITADMASARLQDAREAIADAKTDAEKAAADQRMLIATALQAAIH